MHEHMGPQTCPSKLVFAWARERGTFCALMKRKGAKCCSHFFFIWHFPNWETEEVLCKPTEEAKGSGLGWQESNGDTRQQNGKVFWERGRRVSRGSARTGKVDLNWWERRESGHRGSAGDRVATVGGRLYGGVKEHDGAYGLTGRRKRGRARRERKNVSLQ